MENDSNFDYNPYDEEQEDDEVDPLDMETDRLDVYVSLWQVFKEMGEILFGSSFFQLGNVKDFIEFCEKYNGY